MAWSNENGEFLFGYSEHVEASSDFMVEAVSLSLPRVCGKKVCLEIDCAELYNVMKNSNVLARDWSAQV